MDIIEQAKQELGSGLVAYTEFVLDFKKNKENIYCFFEGNEDRSYYSIRTKMIYTDNDYFDYVCKGKGNLIKLHQLINYHDIYKNNNVGYFVDSDFDGKTSIENIYTTPFYSIENFYVVENAFENILINEFNISRRCDCFKEAKLSYNNLKNKFHEKIVILNSWLACQADYRKENNISTRLKIESSLKSILSTDVFNKLVNPDLSKINFPDQLLRLEDIEKIFNNAPKIEKAVFEKKLTEFKTLKGDEKFRGKFELRFLVSYLNRFKDEIGKKKSSIFSKKYSTSLRFEYATSVSQLTNNAITPDCLIEYLKRIKNVA
ncbi:DUF4435 domain-containing protein [Polaribacter vadi]|uniref:DUF4435 domain-containing protein n=1 Tax=Polaribacter TaxID=52959 RepID=UPI001C0A48B0|nr:MULTISPECIES: DUF4435 domain-containing protein [Polaribacter]MBU3011097.1 DUF4435 domain-containing protein [Polaribacter vadi]MDO6740911.1 DUF4435 domain-containing protein [Polaribacter sp. 1_MG-2023]